ncbi:hypothetical protein CFI11_14105 [Thalassococcus sp. S3]|nr:hypothetical protein CFI11_14105 [Thalassococcus sp. S3]
MNDGKGIDDKRQRDFDDLQHELTGRDVGRISRFLAEGDVRSPEAKRKKAEREHMRRSLSMLLDDPIYRARYDRAMDVLRSAEQAVDQAQDSLGRMIRAAQIDISSMENRAARLPDGTLVFRDATGTVRSADGTRIESDLAATILWTGQEPSFEEYRAAQQHLEELHISQDDIRNYEVNVLGSARNRLMDEDNPPSFEELDDIMKDIEAEMPDRVRHTIAEPDATKPAAPVFSTQMVPDLGANR